MKWHILAPVARVVAQAGLLVGATFVDVGLLDGALYRGVALALHALFGL